MDPTILFSFYLVCFLLGGTLMVLQFLMGLLGLGGHDGAADGHDFHDAGHDVGHDGHGDAHDHAATSFVKVLSFRAIVAALTFFGLAGLAAGQADLGASWSFAVAVAAGGGALVVVGWVMRSLSRLQADGTVRIERAIGTAGTVYLTVPGSRGGVGKVTLVLQNRSVECQAVTAHQALPTGTKVIVTAVVAKDTVEVAPAE